MDPCSSNRVVQGSTVYIDPTVISLIHTREKCLYSGPILMIKTYLSNVSFPQILVDDRLAVLGSANSGENIAELTWYPLQRYLLLKKKKDF